MAERKVVKAKTEKIVVNAADYKLLLEHARLSLECATVFATQCPHKIGRFMGHAQCWFSKNSRRLERVVTFARVLPPVRV